MNLPVSCCQENARSVLEVGCYLGNSGQFGDKRYLGVTQVLLLLILQQKEINMQASIYSS